MVLSVLTGLAIQGYSLGDRVLKSILTIKAERRKGGVNETKHHSNRPDAASSNNRWNSASLTATTPCNSGLIEINAPTLGTSEFPKLGFFAIPT
jgi:hypothetical protein